MSFRIEMRTRVLPIDLESAEISLECPECKAANKVSLDQIIAEETVSCLNCGVSTKLVDKNRSVRQGTRKVQKALNELERTLKELER